MKKILKAPAKVNLFLSVNSKRNDGFHDLTMIMQPISLFDTIEIEIKKNNKKFNSNLFKKSNNNFISNSQVQLVSNLSYIPTDDRNLIVKVIKFFFEKYNIKDNVYINLKKMIPTCGGLGGGSSDAATMILYLNEYYKTNLTISEMNDIAARFGSDIPFFLYKSECICEGKGEVVTKITSYKNYHILISTPNIKVSTKEIFDTVDNALTLEDNKIIKEEKFKNCINAIKNKDIDLLSKNLFNDLENVTCKIYKDINEIKKMNIDNGAIATLMSGSGPSVFGIYNSYFSALKAKKNIKQKYNDSFIYLARPI